MVGPVIAGLRGHPEVEGVEIGLAPVDHGLSAATGAAEILAAPAAIPA